MEGNGYSSFDVRLRAVKAVLRGRSMADVADAFGTDRSTVFRWVKRYEDNGEQGLLRRPTSGRPRKLQDLDDEDLCNIVFSPASEFGFETDLWTVRRLHRVIRDEYDVVVSKDTIWRRLRAVGLTYQKPERQYYEIDEEAREAWMRDEVPRIRETARKCRAILYFQDESNVSLTPFLGKTWSAIGVTPQLPVTGKRGGVAAMSAVTRRGHLLFRLHEKRITSTEVIDFLQQMLHHHRTRHLLVVMDQAPPHTSKRTKAFIESQRRLHVFYLPKYSPDWNPDEKVWNHLKHQELSAHQAKNKAELKQLAHRKLTRMANNPHLVRGIFFRCCVAELFG